MVRDVRCSDLSRHDFQRILGQARTPSVARQLRRALSGLVNAGLVEGYLVPRQVVMRGVRWPLRDGAEATPDPTNRSITQDEIPATDAVHALARECAERSRLWWRELEILVVAYSGL